MTDEHNTSNRAVQDDGGDRQVLTSISFSNVMWIVITVVSVASFIFTYDTRISVLEEQFKSVPVVEDQIGQLQDKLERARTELQTVQLQLSQLNTNETGVANNIESLNKRVRELRYRVRTLETKIKTLQGKIQ